MLPSYEMHPMAIQQMNDERLSADIDDIDRWAESARNRRASAWPVRTGGIAVVLIIVAAVLV